MSNPDDPQAWLSKAENDLLNIRNNLASEHVPWDTVAFHSQQSAEKVLKAFLVGQGSTPPRTHDLMTLLAACVGLGGPFESLEHDCRLLQPYSVAQRYPGSLIEPAESDAREAAAAAERVFSSVSQRMGP